MTSWIDGEFEKERQRASRAEENKERELHRMRLLESKGRELWDMLKAECESAVKKYNAGPAVEPSTAVTFEDISISDRFIIRREYARGTSADVILRLLHYQIEVTHRIPSKSDIETPVRWYFTIGCDGIDEAYLKSHGDRISLEKAAYDILKPVLFPNPQQ